MELANLNSLTVDANGRVSFSGLSSGIDFQEITEAIIAAKRIPIDSIETRITENTDKITALEDLRALLGSLRNALDDLRGAVTLGNAGNVFAAKQIFATTSRSDGSAPSAAGNLVGASTTNAATAGSHTMEVLRVATAHKVASSTFADKTSALGLSGSFEVGGNTGAATITVDASDSLQDIRDRINNANSGVSGTGVTASIVQASSTEFVLVLTADDTGSDMTITDSGSVLSGLGISSTNGSGGFRNGLADVDSKIDATSDGFKHILFDGTQADNSFLVSYDQATNVMTLTRGDGTTDTATLSATAIASGATETATFDAFGVTIVLDENFDKAADVLVDADTASVTGGTGAIDAATIKISDSTGDISAISSTTLTFGSLATPAAISVSVGGFSGTFDGTSMGTKTVTLSDGGGNTLEVQFDVTATFDGTETAASIDLQELENLVAATGTQFDNQLRAAQTARFTADGLIDIDRFESNFVTNSSSTLASLAPNANDPGSFDIKVGSDTVTVNYLGTDTLSGLVTKINTAITTAGGGNAVFDAGTAASLMSDGDGVRLVLTNTSGSKITLTDSDGLLSGLGIDNELVIERSSNTVNDLFNGITLSLFQAEEGTQIKLDVEQDLTAAKVQIENFVTAYNDLKASLNQHSQIDSSTGTAAEGAGLLFGSSTLLGITSSIANVFSNATQGVNEAFSVLAQIGITFVDNSAVSDPLLANTLEIDDAVLDDALLNSPDDIRRLFAFDFSSSDPSVSLLGFTGQTSYDAAGYTLNINFDDRFQSQTYTDAGSFTELDATTAGPAADGISAIAFDDSVLSGNAYRYSYDGTGGEMLTLTDLTSGTSETVDITAILDAAAVTNGPGGNLAGAETATIDFSTLGVTFTLDSVFDRTTDLVTTASQSVTTGGDVTVIGSATALTDQDGGVTQAGLNDLKTNVTGYTAATGVLTINTNSAVAGSLTLAATTGLEFSVDGGMYSATPADNLDDAGIHTIDVRLASSGEVIGRITLDDVDGTGAGAGTLAFDVGTGMFAETSTVVGNTAPMENYITGLADGSFEIRDSTSTLLGTVNYNKTDSLLDLASAITAAVPNVSATVINSGSTFKIEILHDDREVLSFTGDSGGLISQLNLANAGDGVFEANINGTADGNNDLTASVSGRTITATGVTGAEGLKVFYDGNADVSGITMNVTVGFGARLFGAIDEMLSAGTGLIDSNISTLNNQNDFNQSRVDEMLVRLERTRESLLQRFINMEAALAQAKNLQNSIQTTFDALFASQKS